MTAMMAPLLIPNLGSNIPEMGRKTPASKPRSGLADALFSRTQQAVLGLLFGQPDRSFYATEIMAKVGAGSGAVQRELARLEQSGLATVRMLGTQKHFQANPDSPLFAELCSIAQKTVGIAEPLRRALEPLASRVIAAFVYGSLAKRSDTALSDVDVMIVSDALSYAEVFGELESTSKTLGRTVNPTVYTRKEWAKRVREQNSFVVRVMEQPKIWLFGSPDELCA